ncbi:hypothetical protein F4804DRAFT_296600 [Jackrogersella minutella]|nr:hypothetical protein F4804DRAFT_296600 [Jackrogersella minutella]
MRSRDSIKGALKLYSITPYSLPSLPFIMGFSQVKAGAEAHQELPPIEALPVDVLLDIMRQLPDIKSLMDFTKASPSAFRAFHFDQGIVLQGILSRELGPHLPVAVARLEAAEAEWRPVRPFKTAVDPELFHQHIAEFCRGYLDGQEEEIRVPPSYFTLDKALKLWSFNDCVLYWTEGLSMYVSNQTGGGTFRWCSTPYYRRFNEIEKHRVKKVLYLSEIVSILLPVRYGPNQPVDQDVDWQNFWACFAPWEFCQYVELQEVLCSFHQQDLYRLPDFDTVSRRNAVPGISKILALQMGLEASVTLLEGFPILERKMPKPSRKRYSDIAVQIVKQAESTSNISYRSSMCRSSHPPHRIMSEYKTIWLEKLGTSNGTTIYSLDPKRIKQKYKDLDPGPLACWLFDVLRYDQRPWQHYPVVRGQPRQFIMTAFWRRRRWDSERIPLMPPLADLESDAGRHVLTEDNEIVPRMWT